MKVQGLTLQLGVDGDAELVCDALARSDQPPIREVGGRRVDERDCHHRQGEDRQVAKVVRVQMEPALVATEKMVDGQREGPGLREVGSAHDQGGGPAPEQRPPFLLKEGPEGPGSHAHPLPPRVSAHLLRSSRASFGHQFEPA